MNEKFAIPGASAIIVKIENHIKHILIQERVKLSRRKEFELIEIPGGKVRENESIFDTLRREVAEETGLSIVEIVGERDSVSYEYNGYRVVDFEPFCCTQNIIGKYPVMCMVFICRTEGTLLEFSSESKNYRWISISSLKKLVSEAPEKIYPMNIAALKKFVSEVV
ncbi:MAG: NUDIX domain-containing protein [Oscillospiraceae bacterium]|nr:NUDIX domain-containing protein [Oscillospiraceae bacterium]